MKAHNTHKESEKRSPCLKCTMTRQPPLIHIKTECRTLTKLFCVRKAGFCFQTVTGFHARILQTVTGFHARILQTVTGFHARILQTVTGFHARILQTVTGFHARILQAPATPSLRTKHHPSRPYTSTATAASSRCNA